MLLIKSVHYNFPVHKNFSEKILYHPDRSTSETKRNGWRDDWNYFTLIRVTSWVYLGAIHSIVLEIATKALFLKISIEYLWIAVSLLFSRIKQIKCSLIEITFNYNYQTNRK